MVKYLQSINLKSIDLFMLSISAKKQGAAFLWAGSFDEWLTTFGIRLVNTTFHHEHGILASLLL